MCIKWSLCDLVSLLLLSIPAFCVNMDPAFGIHFTQFGVVSAAGLLPQNYLQQQHQQQIQVQLISQQVAASTTIKSVC